MRRSEGRILTSHTGRLFKPGSGWVGMGGGAQPVSVEQLQDAVTSMVQAQIDIGVDIVSNGQVAAPDSYNVYEAIEGFEAKPVDLAEDVLHPPDEVAALLRRDAPALGQLGFEAVLLQDLSDGLMRDAIHIAQFDELVGHQPQRPASSAYGR